MSTKPGTLAQLACSLAQAATEYESEVNRAERDSQALRRAHQSVIEAQARFEDALKQQMPSKYAC
jgi:hypothetical protein